MQTALQQIIDEHAGVAPGLLLSVNAPFVGEGLHWQGAAGVASRETGAAMRVEHAFRIASMSKTFTGLLCAQLVESEKLSLDSHAIELLPGPIAKQLRDSVIEDPGGITVELLLQHRAGFEDFALSQDWFTELAADPGRFRAPQEIAGWALDHLKPVGAPGQRYHYSDTGYVLLGLILEEVTGKSYAELCRERIFEPLEMHHTYLEGHEDSIGELAHCYLVIDGEYIDALQISGSCDWAAGGHVSTLGDLDKFLRGTFDGRITDDPSTLDKLLAGREAKPGFFYGMGIGRKVIHGKTLWGHLGHWGSFMYWCPEERLSLCGMLSYDGAPHNEFIERVLRTVYP
jgi:D-alanyl-D-alanine carboxypeptidase